MSKRECDGTWLCVLTMIVVLGLASYGLYELCLGWWGQISYAMYRVSPFHAQ